VQFRTPRVGAWVPSGQLPIGKIGRSRYTAAMKMLRPLLLVVACALPAMAVAQWQWLDKDGRKVFSDRAPPADIPADKILKQPSGSRAPAAASAEPAAAAASAPRAATASAAAAQASASAPKPTGKDKDLEARKKQMEADEASKKKAEQDKLAAARAENCKRAKADKAQYDSGVRIARINDKGEREVLEDKQREAESKRADAAVARECV
jgi:hypothetical protein